MTAWSLEELHELVGMHPTYLVTKVATNRIVCRRLRRKHKDLIACERKMFAPMEGVSSAGVILYEDKAHDGRYVFKLTPTEGTPFKVALDRVLEKGL